MDEGLLNDLLECSVCLERLDTSSRVLPCQHTFCLKCLKVIVESHKELRCPECRVLVEARVEELPPNVLLMRILEGMRNQPRRPRAKTQHAQAQQSGQPSRDGKQLPPHARAMYDYVSKEPGDLSFKKGDTILLQKKLDPYWYQGESSGRTGVFPITYVQVIIPLQVPTALCKALYDFRMSAPDEEGCLAFDKGTIITVHRRVDENWAEGRVEQRVGIFPIAFVELNQAARLLMNSTPLNRPVPSVPDQRAPHAEHRHHTQLSHRYQPMSTSVPVTQTTFHNTGAMTQSQPTYQPGPRGVLETNKHSLDLIHFHAHGKGTMGVQSVPRIGDNYDRIRGNKLEYSTPVHKIESTYQNVRTHEQSVRHDANVRTHEPGVRTHEAHVRTHESGVRTHEQTVRAHETNVRTHDPNLRTHEPNLRTHEQNVRTHEATVRHDHFPVTAANFNNASSDSSSSMNTASASTTTPNTSSDTSACASAEPSLPSSPDYTAPEHSTKRAAQQEDGTKRAPHDESTKRATHQEESTKRVTHEESTSEPLDASMGVLCLNESSTATNTSLNVSLPAETKANEQEAVEVPNEGPSSSKNAGSGPDSLLNFGLGLQAVLSLSHKDSYNMTPRARDREKRHSLTPSSHLQHTAQNRHSAEIVATSLLDQGGRRRERSSERLPAPYIAIYPYKPQKPDELELKKGAIYTVTERCRDGWYKGWADRSPRAGVFPGNYVQPHPHKHDKVHSSSQAMVPSKPTAAPAAPAPDAPPRGDSPPHAGQQLMYSWNSNAHSLQSTPRSDKAKDKSKSDKCTIASGVSLMKRLAAMKKCKSPPPAGYSIDNPVFEDTASTSLTPHPAHPAHVRSGSCPSQLLRAPPAAARHKERDRHPHNLHRSSDSPWQSAHRKSQSLDVSAARRDRHHTHTAKEKFRCIVPYPPNSEYELELKVDDIVIVTKKRGDGWYKGTLQRTGRTGLFPASFVQSCPPE